MTRPADSGNRCPLTYAPCGEARYSRAGLRRLSPRLETLHPLAFTSAQLRREAVARAAKMSIQGMQPKVSAVLNARQARFDLVDRGGTYILKPQTTDYPDVPENEDLTMRMATQAGIETPLHGLVYTADGALCYLIKRFDRRGRGRKAAVEDFAQLTGKSRQTKYDASMEQVATVIDTFCTFPAVERLKLFRRTLFAYLTGNEDMHLKNFSLITRDDLVALSPAYDLLNTTIVLPGATEELALPLRGKKFNFKQADLIDYFGMERLCLPSKAVDQVLSDLTAARTDWHNLLNRSFLSEALKAQYTDILAQRCAALGL